METHPDSVLKLSVVRIDGADRGVDRHMVIIQIECSTPDLADDIRNLIVEPTKNGKGLRINNFALTPERERG